MKSKRSLMMLLVGLAMLATPITAAAYNNHNYSHNNSRAAHVSRSSNAPARFSPSARNAARAARDSAAFATRRQAGGFAPQRDFGANRTYGTVNDYQNYGRNYGRDYVRPGYYPAPSYPVRGYAVPAYPAAGPYYGAPGYAVADPCRRAASVMYNYYRDRNTGHPAAAYDLLARNQWAFHSGCAGVGPGAAPLFSGFGGLPAYNGYGGYGQPYGGYNGGYGQPYGGSSILGPLIQQFVR